jgi:hypothetical protein
MTSPDTGSSRPGRVAGVALLGLAAVALVIGLITALGGNGDGRADGNNEEQPPRQTSSSRPSEQPSSQPQSSNTSTVPPPGSGSGSPTTTTTTGTGQTVPPDGNGEPTKQVPVRVLNNSKIKGLAAEAANDLKADGWNVTETGNYSAGIIPTTTVYYRPGTEEEAAARAIGEAFGMRVSERFDGIKDASPGVIVIVTNDYGDTNGGKNEG